VLRSGNPGPAGAGAVLLCDERGAPVAEAGVWLGPHSTCNEAEYTGLIAGLRLAARCGVQRLRVQGGAWPCFLRPEALAAAADVSPRVMCPADSTLVTRQMKGEWRCTAPGLMPLQAQAVQAATAFEAIDYAYIPRAENARVRILLAVQQLLRSVSTDAALLHRRMRWQTGPWTCVSRSTPCTPLCCRRRSQRAQPSAKLPLQRRGLRLDAFDLVQRHLRLLTQTCAIAAGARLPRALIPTLRLS